MHHAGPRHSTSLHSCPGGPCHGRGRQPSAGHHHLQSAAVPPPHRCALPWQDSGCASPRLLKHAAWPILAAAAGCNAPDTPPGTHACVPIMKCAHQSRRDAASACARHAAMFGCPSRTCHVVLLASTPSMAAPVPMLAPSQAYFAHLANFT